MGVLRYLSSAVGRELPVSPINPLPVTGAAYDAATNPNPNGNPATIYTDQQAVTASALPLTAQALANGIVVKAKSTNAGTVFVGGASVNTTNDGSGNGYALAPGEAISFGVTNASAIYIIGTLNDVVYVSGN